MRTCFTPPSSSRVTIPLELNAAIACREALNLTGNVTRVKSTAAENKMIPMLTKSSDWKRSPMTKSGNASWLPKFATGTIVERRASGA